jgi:hypothetical protein
MAMLLTAAIAMAVGLEVARDAGSAPVDDATRVAHAPALFTGLRKAARHDG